MKWSIKQIEERSGEPLQFLEDVDVKSALMERESDIIDVSSVKLNGTLLYDNHSVIAMFSIQTSVTLPSSRTLNPVDVSLDIDVCERYVEADYVATYAQQMKDEIINPLDAYFVDLKESVIDNILLNLPLQVLSYDEKAEISQLPSGEGWVLYTEDAYNTQKQKEAEETVDPRFAGLKALQIEED